MPAEPAVSSERGRHKAAMELTDGRKMSESRMKRTIQVQGGIRDVEIRFGIDYPPIEKQVNRRGWTLGGESRILEDYRGSLNVAEMGGLLTAAESDRAFSRLLKMVAKAMRPLRGKAGVEGEAEAGKRQAFPNAPPDGGRETRKLAARGGQAGAWTAGCQGGMESMPQSMGGASARLPSKGLWQERRG